MTLKGIILSILLWIVLQPSYCQGIINGSSIIDSSGKKFVLLDSNTISNIAKDLINLDECRETQDSLESLLDTRKAIILLLRGQRDGLYKEINLKDQQLEQYKAFSEGLQLHIKNQDKEAKKQRIAATVKGIIIPTVVGAISGVGGYFIGKYGK